jgi:hypothetical protein
MLHLINGEEKAKPSTFDILISSRVNKTMGLM